MLALGASDSRFESGCPDRIESRMFKRVKEDFRCEKCSCYVRGDGYTNHCPSCLWSKHVDISPGDRSSSCGGLMKPERYVFTVSEKYILHHCTSCGLEKKNKLQKGDSIDTLLSL